MANAQSFSTFIRTLKSAPTRAARSTLIDRYLSACITPVVEGNRAYFVYRGAGSKVSVVGEFNGWNPSRTPMKRVAGTNLFYTMKVFPPTARLEYKIRVDSAWILDPLNPRRAMGGYGENSDLWMNEYRPSAIDLPRPGVPAGRLDTIVFKSALLGRSHPIYIYSPGADTNLRAFPVLYVTDGGDYLHLARLNIVLDNLIADGRITPVVAVCIDPRTNSNDDRTNHRMQDYAANDWFLDFVQMEVAPVVERRYRISAKPKDRAIIGASMGGLIATYAVLKRPEFLSKCGAQSPAYFQADSAVIRLASVLHEIDADIVIQTGTIGDTQVEARIMQHLLKKKGARVFYEEFHEGHNWTNWTARLETMLEHFFPLR
jgi:enterochelin esterase-like enzyme